MWQGMPLNSTNQFTNPHVWLGFDWKKGFLPQINPIDINGSQIITRRWNFKQTSIPASKKKKVYIWSANTNHILKEINLPSLTFIPAFNFSLKI